MLKAVLWTVGLAAGLFLLLVIKESISPTPPVTIAEACKQRFPNNVEMQTRCVVTGALRLKGKKDAADQGEIDRALRQAN